MKNFENIFEKHYLIFENENGKEIKWFLKKILKLENKKDMIENYFEKDVIEKIWLKNYLKRFDF